MMIGFVCSGLSMLLMLMLFDRCMFLLICVYELIVVYVLIIVFLLMYVLMLVYDGISMMFFVMNELWCVMVGGMMWKLFVVKFLVV